MLTNRGILRPRRYSRSPRFSMQPGGYSARHFVLRNLRRIGNSPFPVSARLRSRGDFASRKGRKIGLSAVQEPVACAGNGFQRVRGEVVVFIEILLQELQDVIARQLLDARPDDNMPPTTGTGSWRPFAPESKPLDPGEVSGARLDVEPERRARSWEANIVFAMHQQADANVGPAPLTQAMAFLLPWKLAQERRPCRELLRRPPGRF
jgi:hypothetical protein